MSNEQNSPKEQRCGTCGELKFHCKCCGEDKPAAPSSKTSVDLLQHLETWIEWQRNNYRTRYRLCVDSYPHPKYACDFHPMCEGCLVVAAALELRKQPGEAQPPASKTVTKRVEEGMRLRHAEVERASDKLSTAGAMAYLSHLDRGELLAEVERLRNALAQSIETVKRLMAESRPDETTPRRCHCGKFEMHPDMALITDSHAHDHVFDGTKCDCEDTPECSAVEPSGPPLYRHDWETLPGGSYRCKRCKTTCLDAHDALLCAVRPEKATASPIPPGRMCNTHGNWNCSECCPPENGPAEHTK